MFQNKKNKKKQSLEKSNSFSNIPYSTTKKQSNISENDSNYKKKKKFNKKESDSDIEDNKSNDEIEINNNFSETSSETYSQYKNYFVCDDTEEEEKKYSESESESEEIEKKSQISSSKSDEISKESNYKSDVKSDSESSHPHHKSKSDAESESESPNSKDKPFFIDIKFKKKEKIKISKTNINVNDPISFLSEKKEYKNEIILDKIEEMSDRTPVIRKIRGDGNCFYRAIGLAWIENLITELNETSWEDSRLYKFLNTLRSDSKLKNCKISKEIQNKDSNIKRALKNIDLIKTVILKKLSKILKLSYKKQLNKEKIIDYINDFIRKMNDNPFFDLAIIVLMRNLTYKGFKKLEKTDEEKNFITEDFDDELILLYEQEVLLFKK